MTGALPVSPEEVAAAHRRLHGVCHRTMMFTCSALDHEAGFRTVLKGENFQRVGAFKIRGAYNFLARLDPEERARGVVAASSGNHGQGVARAAKLFGVPATIVVPEDILPAKREGIERDGARLVVSGLTSDVRLAEAERIAAETGATFVHAFDHPWIVAGQGTTGKEMLEDAPHLDALVVPVGGGGLLAGVAVWAKATNPRIKVFGVEPEGADSMRRSMAAGHPVTIEASDTIADGLGAPMAGERTYPLVERFVDDVVVVTDRAIARPVIFLLARTKQLVEPGGAAGIAALQEGLVAGGRDPVAVVLSGGNVDTASLPSILALASPDEAPS